MIQHHFNQYYFFDGGLNIHKKVSVIECCNIAHFYKRDNQQYRKSEKVFSFD